jgi:hypothetical protein
MSVPGLKDFNRLIDSAQSEIEVWLCSPAAINVPEARISYVRDVLAAIEDSVNIGSLAAGFANVLATVESFGVSTSEVSPSLVRLSILLAEREKKQPLKD